MRNREKGHAMLELAACAGVLVACLAGTFQFGYTFYVYNQLVTAVANGGRYASGCTYRAASPQPTSFPTTAATIIAPHTSQIATPWSEPMSVRKPV